MRIKKDYVLKTIGDETIIVPIRDEAVRFNGIISVNKTAAYLFQLLQDNDLDITELTDLLLKKYDVSETEAERDATSFIQNCHDNGLLIE